MSAPVNTAANDLLLMFSANLLPPEVTQKRQVGKIRLAAIALLVVAVLLVLAGYSLAWIRTVRAEDKLATATAQTNALRSQQGQYRTLIQAQTSAGQIKGQLTTLMADDVTWSTFLRSVRTATPSGVGLTGMVAAINDPAQRTAGDQATASGLPSTTGIPVGTLTITGIGSTNAAIADFVDALAEVSGVSGVLLTGANKQDTGIAFGAKADLSPALLSKLYTAKTD